MEAIQSFNDELSGIYETKPPISRAKMAVLTKKAIKGIKHYKHVVQSIEKFIIKCRPEYKIPGLYVIDSVVRQSRHQFGVEKDVFMPRLCKNIIKTFTHLYRCPAEEKPRILRVLNLWQKNEVFPPSIVKELMLMGGADPSNNEPVSRHQPDPTTTSASSEETSKLTTALVGLLANSNKDRVEDLAKVLTSSQRQQIEMILKKVEKNNETDEGTQDDRFRKNVLDFDYDDEDKSLPPHANSINPSSSHSDYQITSHQSLRFSDQLQGAPSEQKSLHQQSDLVELEADAASGAANHRKNSRSRSRSREHRHRRHRSREHRSRHHSRSRDRGTRHRSRRSRSRDMDLRRYRRGMPPLKDGFISVCSRTLWIGNISGKVSEAELMGNVEEFGKVQSINMIPPRGCAFIVMETRQDASYAVRKLKHHRLSGKILKCDWAPSKEMPDDQKQTWVKEHGVNYVPVPDSFQNFQALSTWGYVDPETIPKCFRAELNNQTTQSVVQPGPIAPELQIRPPLTDPTIRPPSSMPMMDMTTRFLQQPRPPMQQMMFRPPVHMIPPNRPLTLQRFPTPISINAPRLEVAAVSGSVEPMEIEDDSPDTEVAMVREEHRDEMKVIVSTPQHPAPPTFNAISLAQRFPNQLQPVQQIQMMTTAGLPGQAGVLNRMVMPLRMMQMRPQGFQVAQRIPQTHHMLHHQPMHAATTNFPIRMQPIHQLRDQLQITPTPVPPPVSDNSVANGNNERSQVEAKPETDKFYQPIVAASRAHDVIKPVEDTSSSNNMLLRFKDGPINEKMGHKDGPFKEDGPRLHTRFNREARRPPADYNDANRGSMYRRDDCDRRSWDSRSRDSDRSRRNGPRDESWRGRGASPGHYRSYRGSDDRGYHGNGLGPYRGGDGFGSRLHDCDWPSGPRGRSPPLRTRSPPNRTRSPPPRIRSPNRHRSPPMGFRSRRDSRRHSNENDFHNGEAASRSSMTSSDFRKHRRHSPPATRSHDDQSGQQLPCSRTVMTSVSDQVMTSASDHVVTSASDQVMTSASDQVITSASDHVMTSASDHVMTSASEHAVTDFKDEDQKKIKESFNSDQISDEDKNENKIEEYANEDKFADTHSDVNSQQLTRDTSDDVISDKLGIKEDFTEE